MEGNKFVDKKVFSLPITKIVKNRLSQASFRLFSLFSQYLQNKTVDFRRIRARIFQMEGKHADRFTTAQPVFRL